MVNKDALWRRFKHSGDQDARQEIIQAYVYLSKYVVDRLNLLPSAVTGYEDLLGHAIVGLIDAVEKFDPNKDVKFETYAVIRIRGAVLDAVKSLDWIPRSVRSSEMELRRVFARLESELGRPPTDEETARTMGMSVDQFNDVLGSVGQSAVLSLEDVMEYGEDNAGVRGLDGAGDPNLDPVFSAEKSERKRLLAHAIDALPEREKLVISLYYKEGLTLKEIAAVLGVTESRACQLHSKAVVRLHGKLARHGDILLSAA